MDERGRLILQQRAIEALRERVAEESYLTISAVMKRLGLARSTVDALPIEILPYVDCSPTPGRQLRRYHPADVIAFDARNRAWKRAQQRGEGEAYLAKLREELAARDELSCQLTGAA